MQRGHVARAFAMIAPAGLAVVAALAFGASGALAAPSAVSHVSRANADQDYFVASTSASALNLIVTQEPASSIITGNLVNDSLGYTATAFDSTTGSEAQAASVYPGSLVVQGPSLLCSEGVLPFSCPVTPPAYPLLADASYPQHPNASAGPAAVPKNPALIADTADSTAHATATSADGRSSSGTASLVPGAPTALRVASQSSSTTVTTTRNAIDVTVTSEAGGIDIGGLLHIGSVTGTVVQRLASGKPVVDHARAVVSDVTVAGQKATINSHGLVISGRDGPQLLRRLSQHGITVDPVVVTRHDTKRGARSDVTGVIVTSKQPVNKTPYIPNPLASVQPFNEIPGVDLNGTYVTQVELGAAGSAAGFERQGDVGLGGLGPLPVTASTPPTTPSRSTASTPVLPHGGGNSSGRTGKLPTAKRLGGSSPDVGQAPTVVSQQPGLVRGFLDGFDTDLSRLYLVLALGSLGLFAGWRVRVATRRDTLLRRTRS